MKYVIIGNGPAGIYAAKKIRQLDKEGSIEIFTESSYHFFSKPRLPQYLGGECSKEDLFIFPTEWYEKNNITVNLSTKVVHIDTAAKKIITQHGISKNYDKLLITTGSHPARLPLPGANLPQILTIKTIEDIDHIKKIAISKQNCTVIGGGLLGLEIAAALKQQNLDVSVIEYFDRLLPLQLDKEGSQILQSLLSDKGLTFYLGKNVSNFQEDNKQVQLTTKDGSSFTTDLVIVSTGITPRIELAIEGTDLKSNKGILVNSYLQTSSKDVYAAGDCAEYNNRIYGLWSAAMEQGELTAHNMTGQEKIYQGTTVSTMLKVAGIKLSSIGCIDITDKPGSIEFKRINIDKKIYKKLFLQNNVIIGAILIGSVKEAQKVKKLIKDKEKIDNPTTIITEE